MTRDATPQTIYLKDYQVPDYLIHNVELSFVLDEENTQVEACLTVQRNPQSQTSSTDLLLMGENLTLESVSLNEKTLSASEYAQTAETLIIHGVPQQERFTVLIKNLIHPKLNTAFEGLYQSNEMLCTQCEAEGFRKITYFIDRPDIMSRFKTKLIADKKKYPVLLSNGNKIDQGELTNNRHWATWEDPFAKPCYLFALVAGRLACLEDHFVTMSGRVVTLQIYVEPNDIDKCDHAMHSLKNAMRWDEDVFGREYDLDLYMIVAVGHFNMGAMENKGLNIFNTKFVLARPETATDSDYEHIEAVIAHEYFHNWTGNRITCRDWFQLSLKEGLTVFRDQQFTADRTSTAVKRIEDVNLLRTRQFAEDAGPLAHPVRPESYIEINNFYTLTVYEKGAEVVRMLYVLLGKEDFRLGCDLYFQRHDGQAVTCDDFVQAMQDAGGRDLSQFKRWYSQAGTPQLDADELYDQNSGTLQLTLRQSCPPTPGQPEKLPYHMPVKMAFIAPNGQAADICLDGLESRRETILELTEAEQKFVFSGLEHKPVISLLRGYSAPVVLKMQRSTEELAFLLKHDNDSFNRWEAAQQLSSKIILDLVKDIQSGRSLHLNPLLIDTFRQILTETMDDLSYFALLIKVPEESYLSSQLTVIDVEAVHHARKFVLTELATQLTAFFEQLYEEHHQPDNIANDVVAIGKRRIKNTCLSYLSLLETTESYDLSVKQFSQAANMTDQIAALSAIVNTQNPAKEDCLASFYQQWQHEALVIDKWFTIQATSETVDAFIRVQNLIQHPSFSLSSPNRVRSLIGAFSQSNPLHFHAADGSGYRFLTDQIIALNSLNPQVASRMVSALTHWRRYDQTRQQLMRNELQRIVNGANISKDVFETVNKSL